MSAEFLLIDSHCHVDSEAFDEDRAAVLERARAAGVTRMVVVGCATSSETLQRAPKLCQTMSALYPTVGVHPHDAGTVPDSLWSELAEWAAHPAVVAVGETGLDYYYNHSPKEAQTKRFAEQIALAQRVQKPVVCHVRDAHDEARAILREANAGPRAIIHCFTGTRADAEAYGELGCYVSFSGIATFRGDKAAPIREALKAVPADRLLVETDCPYLAPHPLRGKRNEPAFLVHTVTALAAELGQSPATLAKITRENTERIFQLPPEPTALGHP